MQTIEANGLVFSLEEAGSGPPLLWLGGTSSDMRQLPKIVESPLTQHFRVINFDQRGMGLGPKPDSAWTMKDYAEDAAAILTALEIETASVAGYSFGGMVAQELAIRFPERVHRLVLAATAAGGAGGASFALHTLADLPVEERARRQIEISDLDFTPEWQQAHPDEAAERVQLRITKDTQFIDDPGMRSGQRHQLAARATHDTFDRLGKITMPTLVLCGSRDGQAPAAASHAMAAQISGSQTVTVPGSHGFINEASDGFASIIEFLQS